MWTTIAAIDAAGHLACHFDYQVHGPVLAIMDRRIKGEKSVTNAIETVIDTLARRGIDLSAFRLIYRDSQGMWDGIKLRDGRFYEVFPMRYRDYIDAWTEALSWRPLVEPA